MENSPPGIQGRVGWRGLVGNSGRESRGRRRIARLWRTYSRWSCFGPLCEIRGLKPVPLPKAEPEPAPATAGRRDLRVQPAPGGRRRAPIHQTWREVLEVTTHAIRFFRLSKRTLVPGPPSPAHPDLLGKNAFSRPWSSLRFTKVWKDVNRCIGLHAPAFRECTAINRVVADRVHELRHLRLSFRVVAGNGKRPAISGARGAGTVAQVVEVEIVECLDQTFDLGAREPYGLFRLDMNKRLAIKADEAAA
jgi:hypothetical protein